MAHTASGSSTKNGRDSNPKSLGIKMHDGQRAISGNILLRQRGLRYIPGEGVRRAKDDTLYAVTEGIVTYSTIIKKKFDGNRRSATTVAIRAL
jgi:large subunit ribosomal protein L27